MTLQPRQQNNGGPPPNATSFQPTTRMSTTRTFTGGGLSVANPMYPSIATCVPLVVHEWLVPLIATGGPLE